MSLTTHSRFATTTALLTTFVLLVSGAALLAKTGTIGVGTRVLGNEVIRGVGTTGAAAPAPGTFGISGDIDGLYPGTTRTTELRITNPNAVPIRVTSLAVKVSRASAQCGPRTIQTKAQKKDFRVPANGQATAVLRVTLRIGVPNACQGATYPLTYTGSAVQA